MHFDAILVLKIKVTGKKLMLSPIYKYVILFYSYQSTVGYKHVSMIIIDKSRSFL